MGFSKSVCCVDFGDISLGFCPVSISKLDKSLGQFLVALEDMTIFPLDIFRTGL